MADNTLFLLISSFFFTLLGLCNGEGILALPLSSDLKTYIVHVRRPALMASAGREELERWHGSFLPPSLLSSGEPRLVYSYDKALSGFAARLTPEELEAMAAKEGFLYAYPDEALVPETTSLAVFLRLFTLGSLWSSTAFGSGVIVGVIDSGINPNHVSFGDNLFENSLPRKWRGRCDLKHPNKCNKKLIGVRNFDNKDPQSEGLDLTGHGTFVADVAVGQNVPEVSGADGLGAGDSLGLAPKAHLAVYRASRAAGLIASFDQAIYDGVDVICISMTLPNGRLSQNDIAIASLSAVENGILVSAAGGNHGPRSGSVRNVAPWLFTVGASTTDRALTVQVNYGDGRKFQGESLYNSSHIPSGPLRLSLHDSCSTPLSGAVGMAVLCRSDWRVISPAEQAKNVLESGGVVMIHMNDHLNGSTIVLHDTVLPTVFVRHVDGESLAAYARSVRRGATVELFQEGATFQAVPTPAVAGFSGRGPSAMNGGIIKPDVIAPGVNILASSFAAKDEFVFNSGTSASAAIIASVSAMLKKNHPEWSPAAIRSAIMTTADYHNNEGKPITDQTGSAAGALAQGAGHINQVRADDPGLVYDISTKDYLRYLCGLGYTDYEVDAVARRTVHCASLGSLSADELNYPSIAVEVGQESKMVSRTVTNVGPDSSVYAARVTGLPSSVVVQVDPAELTFAAKKEKQSFTVYFNQVGGGADDGNTEVEGSLTWHSTKSVHAVRIPIRVTLA